MADSGVDHNSFANFEAIRALTARNWTKNNKFWLEFRNNPVGRGAKKIPELSFFTDPTYKTIIASSVIDCNIYDVVTDPLEQYIDEQYVQTQGRIQSSQISVKFRDYDQAYLYRRFHQAFYACNRAYMEDARITITLCLEGDWGGEQHNKIAEAYNCIMMSLSGLTFDYASQNQFLEFTVTFKTPKIHFNPNEWLASNKPALQAKSPVGFAKPSTPPKSSAKGKRK